MDQVVMVRVVKKVLLVVITFMVVLVLRVLMEFTKPAKLQMEQTVKV